MRYAITHLCDRDQAVLGAVAFSATGQLLLKAGATHLAGLGRLEFLVAAARELGFDATTAASTLVAIEGAGTALETAMAHVVYLPVYSQIPLTRLAALAELICAEQRERLPEPSSPAAQPPLLEPDSTTGVPFGI